jgi:hypothetical protein
MSILKSIGLLLVIGLVALGGIDIAGRALVPGFQGVIATAHAVIGRPLTPVSVAGVARRTARRCAAGVYDC